MRSILIIFHILLVGVYLLAPAALAAQTAPNSSGGGTTGYTCSTTDSPGDLIPGRSCSCTGGWDSQDCKDMLAEVCESNDLDKQSTVCSGKTGGPIESCSCHWKSFRGPQLRMKLQQTSPGTVMAPAN